MYTSHNQVCLSRTGRTELFKRLHGLTGRKDNMILMLVNTGTGVWPFMEQLLMYLAQPVKRCSPTNRGALRSAIEQQSKDSNTLLWAASFMGYPHEVALKILGMGKKAVALGLRVEPGTCSAPSSSINVS